jgi:hypothetical protein
MSAIAVKTRSIRYVTSIVLAFNCDIFALSKVPQPEIAKFCLCDALNNLLFRDSVDFGRHAVAVRCETKQIE